MSNNSICIIIPIYNGWELFQKCRSSLEKQEIIPDQIIIGDDCSTDGTYEKLIDFSMNTSLNVKVFRNSSNRGPGFTRKKALEFINTDYVAFCDCDDWYELNFIKSIKEQINDNQSDLIIFDNYKIIGNNKEKANITRSLIGLEKKDILALYPMSLCRLIVSKEIITNVEFPDLFNGEDGAVVAQIITRANRINVINDAFYNYYYRLDSASNKPSKNAYKNMITAYKIVYKNVDKDIFKEELEFLGVQFIVYASTLCAYKAGISLKTIKRIIITFSRKFPNWYNNKYIASIGRAKRIYLFCMSKKLVLVCKLLSVVHGILIK